MTQRLQPIFLASLLVIALEGCATSPPYGTYSTIASSPQRDTYRAQRANEQGLRNIEKGNYEAAEKAFREALEADLFFAPAHNNLGLTYLQQGKAYEAAWEFQLAAKLVPNAVEPRNNLGLVMEKVAHLDEAVANYEQALKIDPANIEVMGHLARAQIKAGKDSPDLRNLLKRLSFQNAGGTWDQWARQQLLSLGASE